MKRPLFAALLFLTFNAEGAQQGPILRGPAGPGENAIQLRAALLSSPQTYPKIATTAVLAEHLAMLPDTASSRERIREFATRSFSEDEQYVGKHVELNTVLQKRWENSIEGLADAFGEPLGNKVKIPLWGSFAKLGGALAKNVKLQELAEEDVREHLRLNLLNDERTAHALLDVYNIADTFQRNCEAKPGLCGALRAAFLSNFGYDPLAPAAENEARMPDVLLRKRVEGLSKELPQMRQELMDLAGMLGEDLKSVRGQLKNNGDNLEGLAVTFENLIKKVESSANLALNKQILRKLANEERERMKQHVRSLERAALYNSAYLVGGLARSIDGKNGALFEGVLRSGLMVRDSIKSFQASMGRELTNRFTGKRTGQWLFSSVNLVAGIAQAAEVVLGLVFGSDPNAAVIKMLQDISKQIADLSERMEIRFDQIDLRLNTVIRTLLSTFEILAAQNEAILADTALIKAQLQGINDALVQLGHMTHVYEQASANRMWAIHRRICVSEAGTLLSTGEFMECMKLFSVSVAFSEDDLATNSTAKIEDPLEREQVSAEIRQVSMVGPSWLESVRGITVWDWINPVAELSGKAWVGSPGTELEFAL